MKKRIWVIGVVVVAVVGVLVVRGNKHEKITEVKVAEAKVGEVKAYISTTAIVKSKNSKDYYGIQAKVKKINVKIGDKVKKGDALISYETQDLTATIRQAEIQYDNAVLQRKDLYNQNDSIKNKIADLDKQIGELENSTNVMDKTKIETLKQQRSALSPISEEKLKQSDNAVELAKISLDSAKEKLSASQSVLVAENDGIVTSVDAIEGAIGNPMQVALTIQDLDNLKAVVSLGKYDAAKVALGQPAMIKSGDKVYNGKISFIDPAAKAGSAMTGGQTALGVEVDITNKSPELKVDFDVDVDILVGEVDGVINVPAESIKTEKGDKNFVYVLKDNKVDERAVTIGLQSDEEVEIKEGVKSGEKVILNPSTSIKEGITAKEATNNDAASK